MAKLIENAQLLARATRAAVTKLGLELFAPESPGSSVTAVKAPAGMDSGVIVKEFRNRFGAIIANGQGSHEGPDFPHRAPGLLRFRGPVRRHRRAGNHPATPTATRWSTAPASPPSQEVYAEAAVARKPKPSRRVHRALRKRTESHEYPHRRASRSGRHRIVSIAARLEYHRFQSQGIRAAPGGSGRAAGPQRRAGDPGGAGKGAQPARDRARRRGRGQRRSGRRHRRRRAGDEHARRQRHLRGRAHAWR